MVMMTTLGISAHRRAIPRWLVDRKTASRFAGVVILATISFVVSALVMNRTWEARDKVRYTYEIQLQIDRVAWHLMGLQQATEAHGLFPGMDDAPRLTRLCDDVRDDLSAISRLASEDPYQRQQLVDLGVALARYFVTLQKIFAQDTAQRTDRELMLAMTVDVARVSKLVTEMRNHEDGLLQQRTIRADTFLMALLPTLSFSVAVIAFLVVFVARSINRALREDDIVLSEKDGELAAKDMMMREIDHRVRNSLNLVYNLMLFQQRRTTEDSVARCLLKEAANQVLVVARVHERLYRYGSMEAVELGEYLHNLCTDVASFSLPVEAQAAIQLQAGRTEVRAEEAIWLGLIVVELVTNAVKYGNPSLQSPITVEVSPDERELRVVVSDSGAGLPKEFDLQTSKGLGMQVVLLMVRQLHATLEVDPAWAGTRFIVTVPLGTGKP
jgi:two-component sensor histidine kinase